jgi:hypothetical protein
VDVRISPDEYPTPYNVVYLEVSCPALSTRAKSADDNYALAARATPVSLLSCRRSTPPEHVKLLREAMGRAFTDPEYSKAYEKLTAEPAMTLSWQEFETQLRDLPREAETIDLFKRFPARRRCRPGHPGHDAPFAHSLTSSCSCRYCRWIEFVNADDRAESGRR